MDRLTAMTVFVAVAERGSLSRAADTLEMSRAMATRYLAELEDWLGARLLHRTTRRISLTAAGEAALEECRTMLAMSHDLKAALHSGDDEPSGLLRVTCSTSIAIAVLADAVAIFIERYPQVSVDMLLLDRAVNLVEERVDVAIRIAQRIDDGLVARRLSVCHSVLCASPAYAARAGLPAEPHALTEHRCITHHFFGKTVWPLCRGDDVVDVVVGGAFSANDAACLARATLSGAGIAMLPTYLVADDLRDGRLLRVLPEWHLPALGIFAVYQSRRLMPAATRRFIDFLAERFGDEPVWDHGLF